MSKTYFIIFIILIALPVLLLASAITYVCFTLSTFAGVLSLVLWVIAFALLGIFIAVKKKKLTSNDSEQK